MALLLAEGLSNSRSLLVKGVLLVLGVLSLAVQIFGLAVHNEVYLFQLKSLYPWPDELTIHDLSRSPILNQIPLMTREWLDFAWIERTGSSPIDVLALFTVLAGAGVGLTCFILVWKSNSWTFWLPALCVSSLALSVTVFQALQIYYPKADPTVVTISKALERAPAGASVLQLIPQKIVTYFNLQKRALPELGWIEAPRPDPIILARVDQFAQHSSEIFVITDAPPQVPTNGIEASLNKSLVQIGNDSLGKIRLLRYATSNQRIPFVRTSYRFADDMELGGFVGDIAPVSPGGTLNLTLEWRAEATVVKRPDYTVFVHLISSDGKLIAQHDSQPASGYAPTSGWVPPQVVYDHHSIVVPSDEPPGLHLVRVGLYQLASGRRAPVIDANGKVVADFALLDLQISDGK